MVILGSNHYVGYGCIDPTQLDDAVGRSAPQGRFAPHCGGLRPSLTGGPSTGVLRAGRDAGTAVVDRTQEHRWVVYARAGRVSSHGVPRVITALTWISNLRAQATIALVWVAPRAIIRVLRAASAGFQWCAPGKAAA